MNEIRKDFGTKYDYLSTRILTLINFGIIAYFSFFYLVYVYKVIHVLLGVVNEMFTLPLMFLQLVFLVIGIIQLFRKPINYLFVVSLVLLAVCAALTLGSFFVR